MTAQALRRGCHPRLSSPRWQAECCPRSAFTRLTTQGSMHKGLTQVSILSVEDLPVFQLPTKP